MEHALAIMNKQNKISFLLISLLIIVCLYDLLSPPTSVTIYRQAQTAMLTDNFVKEGFTLKGLYLGLQGHGRLMAVNEFPVYNFIVGIFYKLFNNNAFWGKLVSFFSALFTMLIFRILVKSISNDLIAFYAPFFFILLPVNVLMFTSVQPDALGLMFLLLSIFMLNRWRHSFNIIWIIGYSVFLLLGGLCKYPLLVPYIPIYILMFFFPRRKFRFPSVIEILVIGVLFIIPFISWYLYRSNLTDPSLLKGEFSMFLFGDLKRFLSPSFYIRPAIMQCMLVFCGPGIIYFFFGLRRLSAVDFALLSGIILYYIVVPTAAKQYYYLYAITPITAFFMAKGVNVAVLYYKNHRFFLDKTLYFSFIFFVLFALFGIVYVLRKDRVILPASEAMRQVSQPEDLIFVVDMHERSSNVGGANPAVVYFSGRKGWNIQDFKPDDLVNTVAQINSKRDKGAKWLFVTWFTADLEPWYSKYLPRRFKRAPDFNSKFIADELKRRYPMVRSGNNFAILSLTAATNSLLY